jgi:hypothetical protein
VTHHTFSFQLESSTTGNGVKRLLTDSGITSRLSACAEDNYNNKCYKKWKRYSRTNIDRRTWGDRLALGLGGGGKFAFELTFVLYRSKECSGSILVWMAAKNKFLNTIFSAWYFYTFLTYIYIIFQKRRIRIRTSA